MNNSSLILVTGSAGFIGFSVSKELLKRGYSVLGIDSLNSYYDVNLKQARNKILLENPEYQFVQMDICDEEAVKKIFTLHPIEKICHLAAQAGVRYSLTHPMEYKRTNLDGFVNMMEAARQAKVKNFVYASSSSVYGDNTKTPFSETDPCDHPISLYGATKRSNEVMAYSYSKLFNLPCTGLRFFTVYGTWGRPDMALFLFTRAILEGKPMDVYNNGHMRRCFTYIDDIVDGVIRCIENPFSYEIFNLGNPQSSSLIEYIEAIENKIGKKAIKNLLPLQPGDVPSAQVDTQHAKEKLGFEPKIRIEEGISRFVDWYREYYQL